jgi:small subunit ribosomal protein S2
MSRLPAALFVVDIKAEHIAIKEAQNKHSVFNGYNSDPREVIPSNDDASKSIDKILTLVTAAIVEGLSDGVLKDADATEKRLQQLKKQLSSTNSSSSSN